MLRRALLIISATLLLSSAAASGESETGRGAHGTTSEATGSKLPQGSEPFAVDPADFTTRIDNPYWPMRPGSRWVYRETDAEGSVSRVVVTVLEKTKTIMGIEARIVHDRVTEKGEIKEDTYDWYAQDSEGNLWYLGEDTTEYENGKPKSKEGSWEAGFRGALPGVILPAHPTVGLTYREEYYKGHAEDGAQILFRDALVRVPYGRFEHGLQTRNFSGIEPDVIEEKIYARGVGIVLEITVSGGSDRTELVSYERGA
jgi:hypothetical protein